jgi:hypothetical protein
VKLNIGEEKGTWKPSIQYARHSFFLKDPDARLD